jgi:hypothetical protein
MQIRIEVPQERLAEFCRKKRIKRLSLFGSVLREDFAVDSDIDVLVEFEPDAKVDLFDLYDMEQELSDILGGYKVDINTPNSLSKYFLQEILNEAKEQYSV